MSLVTAKRETPEPLQREISTRICLRKRSAAPRLADQHAPWGTPWTQPGKMIPTSCNIGGMGMESDIRDGGLSAVDACRTWRAAVPAGSIAPLPPHGAADRLHAAWR